MAGHRKKKIPADLRERLEKARLDQLALFRALDHLDLTPQEIPQAELRELFELDADFAEALWALDQPPGSLDFGAMVRDTLDSLERLPDAREEFLELLAPRAHKPLARLESEVRAELNPQEAYNQVPGRDPSFR